MEQQPLNQQMNEVNQLIYPFQSTVYDFYKTGWFKDKEYKIISSYLNGTVSFIVQEVIINKFTRKSKFYSKVFGTFTEAVSEVHRRCK